MVNPQVKEDISAYQMQNFVLKYGELSCDVADKVVAVQDKNNGYFKTYYYSLS